MNSELKRIVKRMDAGDLYVSFKEVLRRRSDLGIDGSGNTTVLTSTSSREGKTHVAVSLAVQAAAVHRQRTLLVDAAVQKRGCASRFLRCDNGKARRESGATDGRCMPTEIPLLDLLTWGPRVVLPSTTGDAAQESLADVLGELASGYDLIVIDAGSMRDGPGMLSVLRCADRVLYVVEHRRRSAGQIRSYLARIDSPKILGVVLNKRRYPIPQFIYDRL